MRTYITAILLLAAAAAASFAQSDTKEIRKTVDGTVGIQKETQRKQDDWASEEGDLLLRYKTAKAQVAFLEDREAILKKKDEALTDAIHEFERRLDETERLDASLQDTLNATLDRLERWIDHDLPFLMQERRARLAFLQSEIVKPDVSGAEKLRRLLEALAIEAGYGGTVEVGQERIAFEGDTIYVDVLRLGRVSLLWKTPDGKIVGEYDRASRSWVRLPDGHRRSIATAMEMASRMRPVELIELPLGRIAR